MKKIIFFVVLIIVLASCKKSSSGSPVNTITATINDTPYIFNQDILDTTFYGSDSILQIELTAKDFNLNTFAIYFGAKNKPFSAGTTYGSFGDSVHIMLGGFESFNTSSGVYEALPYPHNSSTSLTVTLTSITTTNIQGTFKGNIYLGGDTTQTPKTVTNGTFNFTKPITTQ
jgi:hypothetical protein